LAAEKLLANADRWGDDAVFSRDLIDLAMQDADRNLLQGACAKAEGAYGDSIRRALSEAIARLRARPGRLQECTAALRITAVSPAQLWQRIRNLERILPDKARQPHQ
jgi:hypothetical protein